jgi:hypothetical protein
MKSLICTIAAVFIVAISLADNTEQATEETFVRSVIESLLEGGATVPFDVATQVIAIDNGEVLSKKDFMAAWPEIAKAGFKKKVSPDEFFAGVDIRIYPVTENKRIMSNKRVMSVYEHQEGDLYCDAGHMKAGMDSIIGYDKAFIYIIRKIDGKWRLIGIGG